MIIIKKINERLFKITSDTSMEMLPVITLLTVIKTEKNRRTSYEFEKSYNFYSMINPTDIILNMGFFELVKWNLERMGAPLDIDDRLTELIRLDLTTKWYDVLSNEKFADNDGIPQYSYLYQLLNKNMGMGQYPTGSGKSEMELAIVDSFQERFPKGNVLIIAPTNLIKSNFIERAGKWDITCKSQDGTKTYKLSDKFNSDSRINVMNPTGYLNSKDGKSKEDTEIKRWLKEVACTVIDETHHASANTWTKFCNVYLINSYFFYSFSATPDVEGHITPYHTPDISHWSIKLTETVSVTGIVQSMMKATSTEKKLTFEYLSGCWSGLKTRLDEVREKYGDDKEAADAAAKALIEYNSSLDETFTHSGFLSDLCQFIKLRPERLFYFLVHKLETGHIMRESMSNAIGYDHSVIFIESSGITPNMGSIEDMKKFVSDMRNTNQPVRMIMSSTSGIEGMDVGDINSVILGTGKNAKMTLQQVGRSRDKDTLIVHISDYGNPIILSQTRKRKEFIYKEYKQKG